MKPKVILRHCATYDPERIKEIILEGMGILGVHPVRRTLVKLNRVMPNTFFCGL